MEALRKHMAVLFLLVAGISLQAQLIRVHSGVSSDSIMIGDQIMFTLHVEAADNIAFELPLIKDTLTSELEVLALYSADTSRAEGSVVVDHAYIITGFDAGTQLIPAMPVLYEYNNVMDTALSMPLLIHIFDPVVDTTQQIKPIKPPINTPVTLKEVLPWVLMGIGAWLTGTLVAALVWMHRQRRKDPEIFSIRPQEPAHIVAFRELDRLKEKKLWESGQVKLYYTRLSDITRRYIEGQYGIPAMERTTGEILYAFSKSNTDDPLLEEMLRQLLELADLVKFAKEDPLPVDNQTNLNNAYLFVQKTYPLFYFEKPAEKEKEEVADE
jgi:hypothetical protein